MTTPKSPLRGKSRSTGQDRPARGTDEFPWIDQLGLSAQDAQQLREGLLESMAEYDTYLDRWADAIRQHLAEQDAKRAEKRKRAPSRKRRASNKAKPARKQTRSARKKGKHS